MKRKFSASLLSVFALIIFSGCSGDDSPMETSEFHITPQALRNTVVIGTWKIVEYGQGDINYVPDLVDLDFTFTDDHTVVATNGTIIYTGSWAVTEIEDILDQTSNPDLDLFFDSPDAIHQLNFDWDALERTGNRIKLSKVEEGVPARYIVFERNQ